MAQQVMMPSAATSSAKFTMVINNFSKLDPVWHFSLVFLAGGYQWRILVHPDKRERETEKGKDLLRVRLRASHSSELPSGWFVNVHFSSNLVNQIIDQDSIEKSTTNLQFNEGRTESQSQYFTYAGIGGYTVNDKVIIETHLSVLDSSSSNRQVEAKKIPSVTPDIPSVICSSSTTTFTWVINSFTKLKTMSLDSDVFIAGDYQWKLVVYPKGRVSKDFLSVYLLLVSPTRSLPIDVDFSFKLVDQILNSHYFHPRKKRQFREGRIRKGFDEFVCLTKLKDCCKGYLVKDAVIIEINMSVFHSSSHSVTSACDSDAKRILLIPATRDTYSATFPEKSKDLSENLSSLEVAQKSISASSSQISGAALQQHRKAFKEYLALSSLEAIDEANAFDEIERIALLLVQHSKSSLERAILMDLSSRMANLKDVVPSARAGIQNMRAQKATLSWKKADVQSRLYRGKEQLGVLEVEFSKLLEDESELERQVLHLTTQREELLMTKNSLTLEMEKINERVAKDLEEWHEIRRKDEHVAINWIQTKEKLARANLSWHLFKQNLELYEKSVKHIEL